MHGMSRGIEAWRNIFVNDFSISDGHGPCFEIFSSRKLRGVILKSMCF